MGPSDRGGNNFDLLRFAFSMGVFLVHAQARVVAEQIAADRGGLVRRVGIVAGQGRVVDGLDGQCAGNLGLTASVRPPGR